MIFFVKKSGSLNLRRAFKVFGGQLALIITLSTLAFAGAASPSNGTLDAAFSAGVSEGNSQVYTSAQLPDGKILVGGSFSFADGAEQNGLARLNADGSLDASFNAGGAGLNGVVYEIIALANGKLLIGGSFTFYNGTAKGGIARLNADGSLDASFNAGGAGTVGTVQTISLQADGRILISGSPTSYNGTARFSVIRLNADGSLDLSFTSPFTAAQFVEEVDVLPNGKIIIGGGFSIGNPPREGIARLNADGSLDTSFNFSGGGVDASVYAVKVQADGKILIGGDFTTYQDFPAPGIARLNPDGALDFTFNPPSSSGSSVEYFDIQPDGKILAAGRFDNSPSYGLFRLNADGSFDSSFVAGEVSATGYHVAVQTGGKIILTGYFNRYADQSRRNIVRLNSNGLIDDTFTASFFNFGGVNSIARQPDGKILVAGNFNLANSAARSNLVRFNADGTLDATFAGGAGTAPDPFNSLNIINVVVVQPDGKILIGGYFNGYNGATRRSLARLNADGSLDASFNASYFNTLLSLTVPVVNDILILPNNQILVGGFFLQPDFSVQNIIRLNVNGNLDSTLTPIEASSSVIRLIRQPDGKILAGGTFAVFGGQSHSRLARLNADCSIDSSFNTGAGGNGTVQNLALQPDGKIIIVGSFTAFNGVGRFRVARLNADSSLDPTFDPGTGANAGVLGIALQNDGKIIIGGTFTAFNNSASSRLARLNSNGSFDASFVSGFDGDSRFSVRRVLLQDDSKLLVGGTFKAYNGVPRNSLLQLSTVSTIRATAFDYDGDGKSDISVFRPSNGTWYLRQSSAGFAGFNFGQSGDKLVPADYDGDGKTDLAVNRNGTWYIQRSQLGFTAAPFGTADDVPQPADYDGDGRADLAVFRPSNGTWYILNSANGQFTAVRFGQNDDKPVVGDYDGDGRADVAVYRSGTWYVQRSALGFTAAAFGTATDKPVPADYDGDGKTDFAVFRPSSGNWYLNRSQAGFAAVNLGLESDLPAAADYDGDGKSDISVFRPSNGVWYLQRSSQGFANVAFGAAEDKPVPNVFVQ